MLGRQQASGLWRVFRAIVSLLRFECWVLASKYLLELRVFCATSAAFAAELAMNILQTTCDHSDAPTPSQQLYLYSMAPV